MARNFVASKPGDKFGFLTVEKVWIELTCPSYRKPYREAYCECKCKCGNVLVVRNSNLRYGWKKSCGCLRSGNRNLFHVGDKFGLLTIKRIWSEKSKRRSSKSKCHFCECDCMCGGSIITEAFRLTKERTSCGCLRYLFGKKSKNWKGYGDIPKTFWNNIEKSSSRKGRKIDFDITIEEGWDLFVKQNGLCALSGIKIDFHSKNCRYKLGGGTASLDRVDSKLGYTIDNVQWVHKSINIMKWSLSQEKFIEWCLTISNFNLSLKE